jgi:hypothetical protein
MKRDLSEYSRNELEYAIDQYVICHKHAERNRVILKRSLLDGICFEPLAEEFGMSVRQIKNVVYKSQEQMFKHL